MASSCAVHRARAKERSTISSASPSFVYTWGCGQHGQLGHGDIVSRPGPTLVSSLVKVDVTAVAAGGSRTAVLDSEGCVYVFGGRTESESGTAKPSLVMELRGRHINQIACGGLHMVALDKSTNSVFQWGTICARQVPPSLVPFKVVITQIAAGGAFTIALSDDGIPYCWGCNSKGQLGTGNTTDSEVPIPLYCFRGTRLEGVACGGQHSIFILRGMTFSCGWNKYGQLGLGDVIDRVVPVNISSLPAVSLVSCGDYHTLFCTPYEGVPNKIFSCGRKQQCGLDGPDHILTPTLLESINTVVESHNDSITALSCCGAFNNSHSLVLTKRGRLYSFGNSKNGECGVFGQDNVTVPTIVEGLEDQEIAQVSCGWMHTVCLTKGTKEFVHHPEEPSAFGFFTPLPLEVILNILAFLSPKVLATLACANNAFHSVCNTDQLWQMLFEREKLVITTEIKQWEAEHLSNPRDPVYKFALKLQPPTATGLVSLWKIRYIRCNKAHFKYFIKIQKGQAISPPKRSKFSFFSRRGSLGFRVLLFGLDAAGKTTILYKLKLGEVVTTIPTIGFNVETLSHRDWDLTLWDLGGEEKIRALWPHYYQGTTACVFVVDSSDPSRFNEVKDLMTKHLSEQLLGRCHILVWCNKQDLVALSPRQIEEQLGFSDPYTRHQIDPLSHVIQFMPCTAVTGEGLNEGLDWLCDPNHT
ncbi:ADPribosylation factor subfamily protein [Pelomyxa schiedti]|nr:ADPribosylation factor subfamily protein [Pelomyxa schiedti]